MSPRKKKLSKKKKDKNSSTIQSVIFIKDSKHKWTVSKAKKWLADHDMKLLRGKKVDIIPNAERKITSFRFRIRDPKMFKGFMTKIVDGNIRFIIGFQESIC